MVQKNVLLMQHDNIHIFLNKTIIQIFIKLFFFRKSGIKNIGTYLYCYKITRKAVNIIMIDTILYLLGVCKNFFFENKYWSG